MVESTLMLKEGDEPISRKDATTVSKVNVVTRSYKESSKEISSESRQEENYRMKQEQGVLQIYRKAKLI